MNIIRKITFVALLIIFITGCYGRVSQENLISTVPANTQIQSTKIIQTNTPIQPTPTDPSFQAIVPTIAIDSTFVADSSKFNLRTDCLKISNTVPVFNDVIILRTLQVETRQAPDILLFDNFSESLRQRIARTHIPPNFAVSNDKKFIAYEDSKIANGEVVSKALVITDGNFHNLFSIPWGNNWGTIVGWTEDNRIIISIFPEGTIEPPVSYVVVDPIFGSLKQISLAIPDFLNKSLYDLPYWGGWYGLVINPTLDILVYPRQSNVDAEMFTYALWDMSKGDVAFDLGDVFLAYSNFNDTYPFPSWSTNGEQFAFVAVKENELPVTFELYRVARNGDVEQLTNLSEIAYIWDSNHSWSPDGTYIAFFMTPLQNLGSSFENVAILNTQTLEVTNLCLTVNNPELAPIWSPDGTQFLVEDIYARDHERVMLVDLTNGLVSQIADNVKPIGWMIKP